MSSDARLAGVAAALACADSPVDGAAGELIGHCRTVRRRCVLCPGARVSWPRRPSAQALAVAQDASRRADALEAARAASEERAADMMDAWRRAAREGADAREAAAGAFWCFRRFCV